MDMDGLGLEGAGVPGREEWGFSRKHSEWGQAQCWSERRSSAWDPKGQTWGLRWSLSWR